MSEKFVPRHSIANEIRKKNDKSKFVGEFLSAAGPENDEPTVIYKQVKVEDITPRFINKYRQSRIEQLAASIRNTNNRLIHPIVLVQASDLPENHEVRKAIEEQGKSINDFKYIIVSGERRYHAWMLLREQEAARIGNKIGLVNQFDTITANILTKTEAINEKAFYADANNQARHLSPAEAVWFIKDALKEVVTNAQKRDALIRMNNGSEIGIDEDPDKAARRFRVDNYCQMLLDQELGVTDWSPATIRNMATVAMNCDDKIADALLSGDYALREAKLIATLPASDQIHLLELFKDDRVKYQQELEEIKNNRAKNPQKTTHADARKLMRVTLRRMIIEREEINSLASKLGTKNNRNELDAVRKYDTFIEDLKDLIENTK